MSRFGRGVQWLEERINLTEIFSFLSIFGLFYTEVDTSKPIKVAIREALSKPLPSYSRWPRVLGLLALLLFLFEAATGILLAFYYQPTPQQAYQSVLILVRDVNFGWFVRQMHIWGAQLLLVILIARFIRFFFRGLYRPPRELVWISAALLFIVATHLDFTGRFLAWNNDVYWSSTRAMELLYSMPLVGSLCSFFVPGVEDHSFILSRFYFLHIVLLPLAFWLILYVSFAGIRRVGLSQLRGEENRPARKMFKAHIYSLLILVFLLFGTLVTLSVLVPVPFGRPVDPFSTPSGTGMPWYLLAPYGFVEFLPSWLPLTIRSSILLLLLLLFVFLPAVDRKSEEPQSKRRFVILMGAIVLFLWLAFSYYGLVLDTSSY